MSDYNFDCPHCGQWLEAPQEMMGEAIDCPSCNGSIELPKPAAQSETETPPEPETKDCPYCGEQILTKAKKCKHCGEILDALLKRQRQAELPSIVNPDTPRRRYKPGVGLLPCSPCNGTGIFVRSGIPKGKYFDFPSAGPGPRRSVCSTCDGTGISTFNDWIHAAPSH